MALIAIECETPGVPPVISLDRATAGILADALAHDLAAQIHEIRELDFVFVGALYDQAQLLRPGWPLHAALADALERLPRSAGDAHVVAIGAHDGRLPLADLEPAADLLGSPMLVMPWLLSGPAKLIEKVGQRLERELLEQGLIGPELALAIGEAFGIKTAHARHMTTLDLCAMACAQYQHAELEAIWQIIEAALLKPDESQMATWANGGTLRYEAGIVHIDCADRLRVAQCRAIFAAHGIELEVMGTQH